MHTTKGDEQLNKSYILEWVFEISNGEIHNEIYSHPPIAQSHEILALKHSFTVHHFFS